MKRLVLMFAVAVAMVVSLAGCGGGSSSSSADGAAKVADVTGKPLPDAKKTLEGLGFKVKAEAPGATFGVVDEANWVVKSQSPTAGTLEAKGAVVELTVERPDASSAAATTSEAAQSPTTTLIHGQALIDELKAQSMPNDPMLMPLVDAEWKGGFLVLTYQSDDAQQAANLCDFVMNGAPPGLTLEQMKMVQVIDPTGNELAVTRISGPGCKTKN